MQLKNARILLTGASGGLGQELARQLAAAGAAAAGRPRRPPAWRRARAALGSGHSNVCADLTRTDGIARTARAAREFRRQRADQQCRRRRFGLLESRTGRPSTGAGHQPGSADPPDAGLAALAQGAAAGGHRQHRLDLRQLAVCRISPPTRRPRPACAASRRPAPRTGRHAGRRHSHGATRDRYADQHRGGQCAQSRPAQPTATAPRRRPSDRRRLAVAMANTISAFRNAVSPGSTASPRLIDRGLAGKLAVIKQHAPTR
jgi:hypothetical protein